MGEVDRLPTPEPQKAFLCKNIFKELYLENVIFKNIFRLVELQRIK